MAEDYEGLSWVLAAFGGVPPGAGSMYTTSFLAERSGLPHDRLMAVLRAMRARAWLADGPFPGETFRLVGRGAAHVGKNQAQLLALDVAAWVKASGKESLVVRELPEEWRRTRVLLGLAIQELISAGALARRHGGALVDESELVVEGPLLLFEFGRGAPLTPVQIQQHIGDNVGRDKIVNSGSGDVVTGNANQLGDESGSALLDFLATLRRSGEVESGALDILQLAAAPNVSRRDVVGIVAEASEREPRVLDQLKTWVTSLPGSLAKSAIAEGLKMYLKATGTLPP